MLLNKTLNEKKESGSTLIAENLSELLQKNNLNANQLANILGIPMMTIRRLLSGETEDPRISTLKIISDYFEVSLDLLVSETNKNLLTSTKKINSYLLPKLTWEILNTVIEIGHICFDNCTQWQSFSCSNADLIGKQTFALESRPSMYPRFPKGTIFIIDPTTKPEDGDIVLIKLKESNDFTLRELIIDPPHWRLSPLVKDSITINFSIDSHEIVGVSLLTMLYNSKLGV